MTRSSTDREQLVSELMLDSGMPGDPLLKAALESIAGLAALPAPAPRGDHAALLAAPSAAPDGGTNPAVDELAKRRRLKGRSAVLASAVVAAMGLGVGSVAASGGFPQSPPEFVSTLIAGWGPQGNPAPASLVPAAPAPDAPRVTTVPAPADPPAAATGTPQAAAPAAARDSAAPVQVPGPASTEKATGQDAKEATEAKEKAAAAKKVAAAKERAAKEKAAAKKAATNEAKPAEAGKAGKDGRPAVTTRPSSTDTSSAGTSSMSFRDSLRLVENALQRIVRLGGLAR
jgi:hypothetical protein